MSDPHNLLEWDTDELEAFVKIFNIADEIDDVVRVDAILAAVSAKVRMGDAE